ncbi:MAG: thioredoxin-dependent thiol peroxidase [Candidatus Kapaibacterium sp.]
MALEAGTKAPEFKAQADGGREIKLSDYKGKWLVLYFYPKDNTPGCTKEACSFKDNMEKIASEGAAVIGVSPDNAGSHDKFKEKYDLNFDLAADPDKEICNLYDVIGEKKMFGKTSMGVIRQTYIIDPEGVIRHVYPKVKVDGHVDDVIEKLRELQG